MQDKSKTILDALGAETARAYAELAKALDLALETPSAVLGGSQNVVIPGAPTDPTVWTLDRPRPRQVTDDLPVVEFQAFRRARIESSAVAFVNNRDERETDRLRFELAQDVEMKASDECIRCKHRRDEHALETTRINCQQCDCEAFR